MAKRYAWGDGRGRVHSRPKRSRSQLRQAVNAKRDAQNPLYDPSVPLSGGALRQSADSLVGLEFGPARAALAQEAARTTTQGTALASNAGDYFKQLAQQEMGNMDREKAIGQLLGSKVADIGTATQNTLQDVGAKADAQRAGLEQQTGLQSDSSRLAEELAAARANAASSTQAAGQDAAAGTANYQGLADLARQSRVQLGAETQKQLLNRMATQQADVSSRQGALEAQVGPATRKAVLDLRQQGFENAATAAGLNLDQGKLQAQLRQQNQDFRLGVGKLKETRRQNRVREKLTQKQINATIRGQDITSQTQRRGQDVSAATQRRGQQIQKEIQRQNRASRESIARANRNGKTLEGADAKQLKRNIANATVGLRDGGRSAKWLRKQGAPEIVIKAAQERAHGGLKLSTVSELRRLGVRVPRAWIGNYAGPIAP